MSHTCELPFLNAHENFKSSETSSLQADSVSLSIKLYSNKITFFNLTEFDVLLDTLHILLIS
jgi:hypothetical protein